MADIGVKQRMDVERLVTWALRDQGLGWDAKEVKRKETYEDYGTLIDDSYTGSHPNLGLLTSEDATIVKFVIDNFLPYDVRVIVTQYGRSATRPPGADDPDPVLKQLRAKNGALRWDYVRPGDHKSGIKGPMMDYLSYSQEMASVRFDRAQWSLWRQGLLDIVAPLNNRLKEHFALDPDAPAEPWLSAKPEAVVIVDGAVAGEEVTEAQAALRSMSWDDVRDSVQGEVRSVPRDWGAPGDAVGEVRRGPLTVVYEAKKQPQTKRNPQKESQGENKKYGRS